MPPILAILVLCLVLALYSWPGGGQGDLSSYLQEVRKDPALLEHKLSGARAHLRQHPDHLEAQRHMIFLLCMRDGSEDFPRLVAAYRNFDQANPDDLVLERLLGIEDQTVLVNAARLAGRFERTDLTRQLRHLACHSDSEVRRAAVEALGKLPGEAGRFEILLSLRDGDWRVRAAAVQALGEGQSHNAARYLVRMLQDRYPFVRYQARRTFFQLADSSNLDLYRALLNSDRCPEAQLIAAVVLTQRGDADACRLLYNLGHQEQGAGPQELWERLEGLRRGLGTEIQRELEQFEGGSSA